MNNMQKLSGMAVFVQAILWAILLMIFFVVLPGQGFVGLSDFNNAAKVAAARGAMWFIVWSDVMFGLATLVSVLVLFRHLRNRMSLLIAGALTIALLGVVGWFVAHDIGFHLIAWPEIERDPASTNYAMDRCAA